MVSNGSLSNVLNFLGFDPCDEYNKGLAELLATEAKTYGCSTNNEAVASNLGNQSWPESSASSSGFFTQVNKDTSQQYSLFGDTSPGMMFQLFPTHMTNGSCLSFSPFHFTLFIHKLTHQKIKMYKKL